MITWLASYPKSGNTWVRMLLNAYFQGGHIDINALPWGCSDNRRYCYQAVSPMPYDSLKRADIIQLRPAALATMIAAVAQKPLFVKTHHAYGQVDDVHLFPKLYTKRAFYIVRDPREIAASYAQHMAITIDAAIDCMADEHWTIGDSEQSFHITSSWSKNVQSWMDNKDFPVHVIKYSKLKSDPGSVLAGMLDRIGFERIDYNLIDKSVSACSLDNLKKQEKEKGFEEAINDFQFFGGSRESLTDAQRDRIESDHGEVMNAAL